MSLKRNLLGVGFTLVEILIGIAVVSVITSAGYVSVANIRESAREKKLEADVSSLNKATQSYLASGGVIPPDADAAAVITKLKTRATSEVAATTVGMTGSFIDRRVVPVPMSESEGEGSRLRAVWNADIQRFVIAAEGNDGIGSFTLNEDLAGAAPETEARTVNLAAADLTSGQPVWVWDYAPNVASTSTSAPPPGSGVAAAGPSATPTAAGTLDAPTFDLSGGSFTLDQLAGLPGVTGEGAFTLSISNPNSTTISYLDSGSSALVSPGASGATFSSRAVSIDPDAWADSSPTIQTYAITPFDPTVAITNSGDLTPFNLGVPRASGSGSSATVTATLSNWESIPAVFRTDANLELVMAVGSNDPGNASGSAQDSVGATLTTNSGWSFAGQNPSLIVSAKVKSGNAALFNASSVSSQTLTATKGTLTVTATPASGTTLNASETITLAASDLANFPADYAIKYTTNGTEPTAASTTYTSPIIPPASGVLELNAKAFSPGYGNWFDAALLTAVYEIAPQAGNQMPSGALVSFANLQNNVQFRGNITIAAQSPQQNMTFFGNSRITGNLYVPGTPKVYKDHVASSQWDNQLWSPATDGNFANYILGRQFDELGNEVIPATEPASPRVVDLSGDANPSDYYLLIQDSAKIDGKIYRRATAPAMPTVSNPGTKTNNNSASYHSWTLDPNNPNHYSTTVDPNQTANFTLTTNATLNLQPGNYGTVSASNNGRLVLGDAQNPDNVQYYSFESLRVNGGAGIEVVGKVVVTMKYGSTMRVDNNGFFGNSAHPEYLQLNVYTTANPSQWAEHVLIASTGAFYGRINAPKGLVTIQENSIFQGAVTAYKLQMTGSAGVNVNFNLEPIHE